MRKSIQYLTRARPWPANETNRWGLFRNPLPPASEHRVFRDVREDSPAYHPVRSSGRDMMR